MKQERLKSNLMLLIAAAIWGLAFVAQRVGAKYLGAFSFNGIRFALGSISLIPLILYNQRVRRSEEERQSSGVTTLIAGGIAGGVLFLAASLQQIGLAETSAGKAAFITGLYIVLVPIFGVLLKHKIRMNIWVGAAVAVIGLYILSVTEDFSISRGDFFELIGAVLWAVHILLIDHFTQKVDALKLSVLQFATCSSLSLIVAGAFEKITVDALTQAMIPILYGGFFSVGIAYTLQVVGQRYAKPSHAAIVLSMETVFASIGGLLILNENLGVRGYVGCVLMLIGMLLSQLQFTKREQIQA
ncbi:MAG: DMT family transporter [Clostridia bacterium]|nr:DMT family transporter [Clostridia bacterium]